MGKTIFLFFLKSNLSAEPCQLPVTEIIIFFFVIAFTILNDLNTASVPELQKINFCNWDISQLINGMDGYGQDDDDRPANKNDKWDKW